MTEANAEQLDDEIVNRFPYPLVATYERAYFRAVDAAEAHDYLLDLFEVTLKYCASIAVAQYIHDRVNNPSIDRQLTNIERPSLGHWQGWLRDILALYRREARTMLVPELDAFIRLRHGGQILTASRGLARLLTAMGYDTPFRETATVTTQQFFDLVVGYRNRLAHGARPSTPDRTLVAELLSSALRQLYREMAFVADYKLVFIRSVTVEVDANNIPHYRHFVTYITGETPRASLNPHVLDLPHRDSQLYLLDRGAAFTPLISLHPFFIYAHCVSCNREQTFVLNMSDETHRDYIAYQCTHHCSPSDVGGEAEIGLVGIVSRSADGDVGWKAFQSDIATGDSLEFSTEDTKIAIPLQGARVTLGRDPESDVPLIADPAISRRHAVVESRNGAWFIRDLGSRNGTHVNGKQISGERVLRSGDQVRLGATQMTFRSPPPLADGAMETTIAEPTDAVNATTGTAPPVPPHP